MKKYSTLLIVVVACIAACDAVDPASGDTIAPVSNVDDDTPNGATLLREASQHIADAENVLFDMSMAFAMSAGGRDQSMTADYYFSFQRPNLINARLESDGNAVEFVSDGSALTTYISEYDAYTVTDGDPEVSEILTRSGFGPFAPITAFLGELLGGEALASLDDAKVTYVGLEDLNGKPHHRLRVDAGEVPAEIWVAAEGAPVIRRIEPDKEAMLKPFANQGVDIELTLNASLRSWEFDAIPATRFAFTAPDGVEKVDSFDTKMAQRPTLKTLLGKTAPPFTLDIMGGGTLDIATKKDQEIVILDFWATWCAPCRKAMPIIEKVAAKYKDQDVRLYAVNLQEEEKQIKPFLDGQKLDVTVVLDSTGEVSQQYFVGGIPATVIIAKDGTVQAVHEGLIRDLEAVLIRELDTLVKGESLVDTAP